MNQIYATALNAAHHLMVEEDFGAEWVKLAIGEDRTVSEAVIATVEGRYGKNVLFTSSNADANMRASEAGFQLVNPKSLSERERDRFKKEAGVETTHERFKQELSLKVDKDTIIWTPKEENQEFVRWVEEMGEACGITPTVMFMDRPAEAGKHILATCQADSLNPTLMFNWKLLGEEFFQPPYGRQFQLEILIHEFGHALARKGMEHGPKWGEGATKAGSLIAVYLRESQAGRKELAPAT